MAEFSSPLGPFYDCYRISQLAADQFEGDAFDTRGGKLRR